MEFSSAELQSARDMLAANPRAGRETLAKLLGCTTKRARNILREVRGAAEPDAPRLTISTERPSLRLESDVLAALRKGRVSVVSLARELGATREPVFAALESLLSAGYNVETRGDWAWLDKDIAPGGQPAVHSIKDFRGGWRTFGATGDNHLGSKHERLDVLNALYDLYEAEGVTEVYNTGNWIEGECRFNKHDIKVFGLDGQIDYWVQNYPQRKGITTYYVAGDDHEGWFQQREGINIGRHAQWAAEHAGRNDLKYLGYVEADIELKATRGSAWMKVMHPGGGAAYAVSYAPQKIVESFQGGEKPRVLLLGHYHKWDFCYPREVYTIQTGCTVDQSIFMRKQKIQAHVGGCLVRINQSADGIVNRCQAEFISFFDRNFYDQKRVF